MKHSISYNGVTLDTLPGQQHTRRPNYDQQGRYVNTTHTLSATAVADLPDGLDGAAEAEAVRKTADSLSRPGQPLRFLCNGGCLLSADQGARPVFVRVEALEPKAIQVDFSVEVDVDESPAWKKQEAA
jgi:hypothetical protein